MDVMEALVNMGDIFAELWPQDDTARILMRIMIHYKFAAGLRDNEAERCKIMAEVCDAVLRENASRAVSRDPPLSFRQAKERWVDVAERYSTTFGFRQQQQQQQRGDGRSGAAGNGGAGSAQPAAKGGAMARSRQARYLLAGRSYAVCFDFNRGTCNRKPAGCGCEDSKGVVFAHVCNFYFTANSKHCLAAHSRVGNH
jgi:hypothetical protein